MRRVVVIGVGAITAQGTGVPALWQGLVAGRVAIRPIKSLDIRGYLTRLGGEVDTRLAPGRDRALEFALAAAREAMAGAPNTVAAERWGVIVGTCNAGLRSAEHAYRAKPDIDWRRYLMIQPQILAEALAAEFGLTGPVLSVNTACASAAHAIAHAVEIIRSGQADAMLVGGSDAFSETVFAGFNSLESLAAGPAAPYSKDREGLSLGEGAGMLVLTALPVARAAGAPVLAEVLGYGLSADGYHPTAPAPDGEGAARAITAALADANLDPEDVAYINGHGTGTPKNDRAESNAVRLALGPHAEKIPMSSTKSMIGHLLGAAAAVEGIATILALRDQVAPPTANFTQPDPNCGLDPIAGIGRPMPIDVALSNNFAFAGANATVVFGHADRAVTRAMPRPVEDVVITGVGVVGPQARHGNVSYVALDPASVVTARQGRRLDRLSLLAIAVSRHALGDARLEIGPANGDRIGVIFGTGIGPVESLERFSVPVLEHGPGAANPAVFPNAVYNAAAGHIATVLGTRGPTSTVTVGHAAGAGALCVAADLLEAGKADALLCVGADALSPIAVRVYAAIPLFGAARRYLLAEGAVALVLERRSAAVARGARILATVAGHAITCDAVGIGQWDAHGAGVERAMRTALTAAGLSAGDLASIWANTTGLAVVDRPEHAAIRRLLGGAGVPIREPKLVHGEPIGAGALQSAALALQEWDGGTETSAVLINSSSLGGTHLSVILKLERT